MVLPPSSLQLLPPPPSSLPSSLLHPPGLEIESLRRPNGLRHRTGSEGTPGEGEAAEEEEQQEQEQDPEVDERPCRQRSDFMAARRVVPKSVKSGKQGLYVAAQYFA